MRTNSRARRLLGRSLAVAAIVVALVVVQPEAKAAEQIEGEAESAAEPRRAEPVGSEVA